MKELREIVTPFFLSLFLGFTLLEARYPLCSGLVFVASAVLFFWVFVTLKPNDR